jgi:hypothetical protein
MALNSNWPALKLSEERPFFVSPGDDGRSNIFRKASCQESWFIMSKTMTKDLH